MLALNFNPFPVLETERLILRAVMPEDAEELFVQQERQYFIYLPLQL